MRTSRTELGEKHSPFLKDEFFEIAVCKGPDADLLSEIQNVQASKDLGFHWWYFTMTGERLIDLVAESQLRSSHQANANEKLGKYRRKYKNICSNPMEKCHPKINPHYLALLADHPREELEKLTHEKRMELLDRDCPFAEMKDHSHSLETEKRVWRAIKNLPNARTIFDALFVSRSATSSDPTNLARRLH